MSNKNIGSGSIGCNNHENTSNYQHPISSYSDETRDQQQQSRQPHMNYQQREHKQQQNHSYNQISQSENQQQVS